MSKDYNEGVSVRDMAEEILDKELGWEVYNAEKKNDSQIAKELGAFSHDYAIFVDRLFSAIKKLNPWLDDKHCLDVFSKLTSVMYGESALSINRCKHDMIINGVRIPVDINGKKETRNVRLIDFDDFRQNDYLSVKELTIKGKIHNRRPDTIGFINGLPLVFFEFKDVDKDVYNAYIDNLRDYQDTIPQLFYFNEIIILSNGVETKVGSLGSPYKFYSEWNRLSDNGSRLIKDGDESNLGVVIRLLLKKDRLLDIVENFILFDCGASGIKKVLARNHQYHGVNKAMQKYRDRERLKGRLGVFWHTQGSGKSYTMVFLAQKILRKSNNQPMFVMVTDRVELNLQLANVFSSCGVMGSCPSPKNYIAQSRNDLIKKLHSGNNFIFTLIQKFSGGDFSPIESKREIVMFFDEAHRSQYGVFAQNLNKLLPKSNRFGFTGTPLLNDGEITKLTFGSEDENGEIDYTSIYNFIMALEDKATVPLYYVNRAKQLGMDNAEINKDILDALEKYDLASVEEQSKMDAMIVKKMHLFCGEIRLKKIAHDFVEHYVENRTMGKAMVVSVLKLASIRMYLYVSKYWKKKIEELKKDLAKSVFLSASKRKEKQDLIDWMEETVMEVVVSDSQNEVSELKKYKCDGTPINIDEIRKGHKGRDLEQEFKKDNPKFRIVFVCAMWLTGFDVPDLAILYLDKPLKAHSLMQTIARANRVSEGKENGLIIDYIGIADELEKALQKYSRKNDSDPVPVLNITKLLEDTTTLINDLEQKLDQQAKAFDIDFTLQRLIDAKLKEEKFVLSNRGANAVLRTDSFKKYFSKVFAKLEKAFKLLLVHKCDTTDIYSQYTALDSISKRTKTKVRHADVSDLMSSIDEIVSRYLDVEEPTEAFEPLDISLIDFDKLAVKFSKSQSKEFIISAIKEEVEWCLNEMLIANPNQTRKNYYEEYNRLIEEYNRTQDHEVIKRVFEGLLNLSKEMTKEEKRNVSEGFGGDTLQLAVFDLLCDKKLKPEQIDELKGISKKLIDKVVEKISQLHLWRNDESKKAEIKRTITSVLYGLPDDFSDDVIEEYKDKVYKFFYDSTDNRVA